MSISILLVDMQNDFCAPDGALYVSGAEADCKRVASFIRARSGVQNVAIDSLFVTLDSHTYYHIAHPAFWHDSEGNEPAPFTAITAAAVDAGEYLPADELLVDYVKHYLFELERKKHSLTIWTPHCLMGTRGHCVQGEVWNAAHEWEKTRKGTSIQYILKGKNPFTEHYSAVAAEVPFALDPETETNRGFIDSITESLKTSSELVVAGEALSHCVAHTILDLAEHIPPDRITLLSDCTSSVAGFEEAGKAFVAAMIARGMKYRASTDIF